jgi:hypothetical protein
MYIAVIYSKLTTEFHGVEKSRSTQCNFVKINDVRLCG